MHNRCITRGAKLYKMRACAKVRVYAQIILWISSDLSTIVVNSPSFRHSMACWHCARSGLLTFPFCKTVWQCCVRDAGRAGFRRSVVGAIFFVSQSCLSAFFLMTGWRSFSTAEGRQSVLVGFTLTRSYTSIVIVVNGGIFCG